METTLFQIGLGKGHQRPAQALAPVGFGRSHGIDIGRRDIGAENLGQGVNHGGDFAVCLRHIRQAVGKGFKKERYRFRAIAEGFAPEGGDSGKIGFDCSSEHRQYLCIR